MATPTSQAPAPDSIRHARNARIACRQLASRDLSEEQILAMQVLGPDGLRVLRELEEQTSRQDVDDIFELLKDSTPDAIHDHMQSTELKYLFSSEAGLDSGADRAPERGRSPARVRAPPSPAARATPPATATATAMAHHLVAPSQSSLRRSSESRPTSHSRSRSPSASTNPTEHTPNKRPKNTPKRTPKDTSKDTSKPRAGHQTLYCPHCQHRGKYHTPYDTHVQEHLETFLPGTDFNHEHLLLGCGYCRCESLEWDRGPAFLGVKDWLNHIRTQHSDKNTDRIRWSFNHSFRSTLTAVGSVRRHFITIIKKAAGSNPSSLPLLYWNEADQTTQGLLNELQRLAGKLQGLGVAYNIEQQDEYDLNKLLEKVYAAAAIASCSTDQSPTQPRGGPLMQSQQPQHLALPQQQLQARPQPQRQRQRESHTSSRLLQDQELTAIGEGAYDASQYPRFPQTAPHHSFSNTQSSPMPQPPFEVQLYSQEPAALPSMTLQHRGMPYTASEQPNQSQITFFDSNLDPGWPNLGPVPVPHPSINFGFNPPNTLGDPVLTDDPLVDIDDRNGVNQDDLLRRLS